jgi:hypothetical protein
VRPDRDAPPRLPAPDATAAAKGIAQLVDARATFDTRVNGMPAAGTAAYQRLDPGTGLVVDYGYDSDGRLTFYYSVTAYVGAPDPDNGGPRAWAALGLGVLQGSTCVVDHATYDQVNRFDDEVLLYTYATVADAPNAGKWNCAVLWTEGAGSQPPVFDMYVSPLKTNKAAPRLTLKAPKKQRMVRRTWNPVTVKVANAKGAKVTSKALTVKARGKGLKARNVTLQGLAPGRRSSASVEVNLRKAKGTLVLTLHEKGRKVATRRVTVRSRPAPKPPRAGNWSSGAARFKVSGRKVKGFRTTLLTTCGGYPDMPTYSQVTYDFPTTRIPRNNRVRAVKSSKPGATPYSSRLDIRFVNRTKAKGSFSYHGPGRCSAYGTFTVTRR